VVQYITYTVENKRYIFAHILFRMVLNNLNDARGRTQFCDG